VVEAIMTKDEIEVIVLKTVATVLSCAGPVDASLSRQTEPRWDSMKHIEVIFALEDAFGIRFDEDELAGLESVAAIARSVERHRAP
jgi:acyl carrier protein